MANAIITPTIYTREAQRILENNLVFTKHVDRRYEDRYAVSGAKIGATLNIRRPARYTTSSGAALGIQDFTESSVALVVNSQQHVDTNFTSQELTLSLDEFSRRVLKPKMAALANKIDYDGMTLYQAVHNTVGTPGTTPATAAVVLASGRKLNEEAAPMDDERAVIIDSAANASMVDALKGLFQSSDKIADQYESGNMGMALGFKWSIDQNVNVHTVGPLGGTPLINGAGQGTSSGYAATTSLVTDGWTAAAANRLKAGDVFTIANVFAVNPQSRTTTGQLRQFVVTADASSDGSGNLTAVISPAIITGGQFQNVNSVPADNAAITVLGAANTVTPQSMAFHREAFTLATVDLEDVSQYGAWGSRSVYKNISLRVARQYRIGTDDVPCRVDVLYGWKAIYPELACRIAG